MKIPKKGLNTTEILSTLKSYKQGDLDWASGRVFGYVYDPGEEATEVIHKAYTMYLTENGLDPTSFTSLLRLENELVRMMANLLGGDENVVGNFTSGGTESIILAVKAARDMLRATKPEIQSPEMVLPITAHSSFFKAAHYLGIEPIVVPVLDDSFRADVSAMADAITENTILLVGSSPSYAHGVIDPITEIGRLAQEKNLLFHVDACVGGIHLSYMKQMDYPIPDFNLSVPGVTSLSVDLHKYGYAAKGASIILYKNQEIRRHQMFACSRWTGYTVINPAVTSSKPGGPMAGAWAILHHLGDDGYRAIVEEVMQATRTVLKGIEKIEGLRVLGKPDMCMLAFTATSDRLNIFRLADRMKHKGWYLQPQFGRENSPSNLHVSLNHGSAHQVDDMVASLAETIQEMMQEKTDQRQMDMRAEIEKLSIAYDEASFIKLVEMAGITGTEIPKDMAEVNQLLEVLPYDMSEFMLTEFLNNIMK
jgi:sphinganine-1-phosphate aldolase